MRASTIPLFLAIFLVTSNLTQSVFAYIDPGSGSMLLQLLLGGITGIAVLAKLYWRRILSVFRPEKDNPSTTDPSDGDQ